MGYLQNVFDIWVFYRQKEELIPIHYPITLQLWAVSLQSVSFMSVLSVAVFRM